MIRISNFTLFLVFFSSFALHAQSLSRVLHVPPAGVVAGQPVELEVILDGPGRVMEARLYHRVEGQSGYQEQDMVYIRSAWHGTVPKSSCLGGGVGICICILSFKRFLIGVS